MNTSLVTHLSFHILDQLPIGVLVLRGDYTVLFWNRCLEDWSNISRDDIVGSPIGKRCPAFNRPELEQRLGAVFAGSPPVILSSQLHAQIIPAQLFNGEPRILDTTVTAVATEAGGFHALFSFQDVTESTRLNRRHRESARALRREAAELERSNKELDQFAYIASHDLREPLRSVDNLSKWIANDLGSEQLPPSTQRHLRQLRRQVLRMQDLLDNLLKYSRAGRDGGELLPVDLGKMSRDLVRLFDRPEQFEVVVEQEMPTVTTAKIPLEQCLRNLISNAIQHHNREDGQVKVSCRDAGDFVELIVADDGPGIAPEFHERIFNMFQTLRPRDEFESSGMGLAIVKKIVETHGGTITLQSSEGNGATFALLWPKLVPYGDER